MRKFDRPDAPEWLLANYEKWGKQYADKRENPKKRNDFVWAKYNKTPVNQLLYPIFVAATKKHCCYCDGYPMGARISNKIEHFRPSSKFPLLAYLWENLFLSCENCNNNKLNFFDERLLKPDAPNYRFNYYFLFDRHTGMIKPNPRRSPEDQKRAEITITTFGFNAFNRPDDRIEVLEDYEERSNPDKDKFSYRFILI